MANPDTEQTVQLLTDANGPYGIGVCDQQGCFETLAVRPDTLDQGTTPTLFHTIPNGHLLRRGAEGHLVQKATWALLERENAPKNEGDARLRHHHGARNRAAAIINGMLARLYNEAVPAEWLRIIRRYPINARYVLYPHFCAHGARAWQLAETFPFLATVIYQLSNDDDPDAQHAKHQVVFGAKLRRVAQTVGVPMEFRHFPPSVVRRVKEASSVLVKSPDVIRNHAPSTVPKMRAWLQAIKAAKRTAGDEYALWVARKGMELGHWREIPARAADSGDWVSASNEAAKVDAISEEQVRLALRATGVDDMQMDAWLDGYRSRCQRARLLGRRFTPEMAPQTVIALSDEWHAQVSRMEASGDTFPEPWYAGGESHGYRIEPITDGYILADYARRFRNCAGTYDQNIVRGACYLYIALDGDTPVAMFKLLQGDSPKLGQVRGPWNRDPGKAVTKAIRRWLTARKRAEGNGAMPSKPEPDGNPQTIDIDGIPF